jgi:hypothetical protein
MSLFGTTKPGGLFGTSQPAPQQQQTSSLFGNTTQQQQPLGGSLFGTSTAQPQQTSTLFGSTAPKPSLFGASTQQPAQSTNLFGSSAQAQQPQQDSLAQSFLAGSRAAPLPRLGQSQWTPAPNPRTFFILPSLISHTQ